MNIFRLECCRSAKGCKQAVANSQKLLAIRLAGNRDYKSKDKNSYRRKANALLYLRRAIDTILSSQEVSKRIADRLFKEFA